VNSTRSLWFESHLFADRAGRRARDACQRLGSDVHDEILARGDRLATLSPNIAQQYYKSAAGIWQATGGDGFKRWFDLGFDLLTAEAMPRDAAMAFFAMSAKTTTSAGLDRLAAWCVLGKQVAAVSRKLGATFCMTTAAFVDGIEPEALALWAHHGKQLNGVAGWRGEFLAHAYFAAAPHALAVLTTDDYASWAQLGAALQSVLREQQFFGSLPTGLAALKPAERALLFATALAAAAVNAPAAAKLFAELPAALRRLHGPTRLKVLQVLQLAVAEVSSAVAEVAPVVGALVHDIPSAHRSAALDLAVHVAGIFARGSVALLRSLPVAYEEARHDGVCHWAERGLQIAADNPEAGSAYFALESRTSIKVLQASSTAVPLSDVQGLLRKYTQMLSGQPASIRGSDLFQLRSPLEEFPHENEIELPLKIDLFSTHEDNVRVYRFLAAQLAGRRELGTYGAELPESANGSLYAFLNEEQQPALLEDWFLVAEGFRVAAGLARAYPGLGREQRELAASIVARLDAQKTPSAGVVFDAVFLWLLSGRDADMLPPWLQPLATIVAPSMAPLASRAATVNDSLRIAALLARQLAQHTPDAPQGSVGDVYTDQMNGDALIAAYLYDDDDSPAPPNDMPLVQENAPPPPPVMADDLQLQLDEGEEETGVSAPLSAEELQKLIESGVDLRIKQGHGADVEGLGLYITDLLGKMPPDQLQELRSLLEEATRPDKPQPRRWLERRIDGVSFYYDEWDFHIADYRQRWCRLLEVGLEGDSGEFFNRTLSDYAAIIPEVRRQFQRIRPEMYRIVRGLEDGEDFDLNAVVDARVDRRARRPPSTKLYVARQREERDVATLFLIDMSASTDEPLQKPPVHEADEDAFLSKPSGHGPTNQGRRIIDVTKEALVIMAEALEEIGDAYAIYGFSGHGRFNVEFYLVKAFNESLNAAVKGRIGAIEPKRSTRMGTALRHAVEKMAAVTARSRHLILLSDGFPQDFDYGQDRRSNVYGLRDTSAALRECETAGITPFCITVDKAGHDYLREMCESSRYMVIDDIASLPRELPKIYQRVVTT
jgi:hypothetical protein